MKSNLIGLALASAVFAAHAVGPYDGIYADAESNFYSVHQAGNVVTVGVFWTVPQPGDFAYPLSNGQTYIGSSVNLWTVLGGQISGASAAVTGETMFGACVTTLELDFNAQTVKFNPFTQTGAGASQSINCAQLYSQRLSAHGGSAVVQLQKLR